MTDFIETARGLVRPTDCNETGALGSPALTARLADAAAYLLARHGLGSRTLRDAGTPVLIHAESLNRMAELRAGDPFHIESRIVPAVSGRVCIEHRVLHSDSGTLAASATTEIEGPRAIGLEVEESFAGLVSYRGRVQASECDQMRHMNVQHYAEKNAQAVAQFGAALGLGAERQVELGAVLHPIRERMLFEREVYAGDVLVAKTAVRTLDADTVSVATVLRSVETGDVSARFESVLGLWDPESGQARSLPDDVHARANDLPAAVEDVFSLPRPITGPRLGERSEEDFDVTCRRSVNVWEVDHAGIAPPTFTISCVSDAAMHFFTHMGADHAWRVAHDMGSAALDYAIEYRKPLHVGVPVELRTRFLETRSKPFRFGHDMVNVTTGEVAVSVEVTAVLFNLTTRKSIVLPDDFRARAVALGAVDTVRETVS